MRLLILFLYPIILTVLSCGGDSLMIKTYEKPKPILWVVAIDITYDKYGSPPPEHFNNYPEFLKRYVLEHCQAGDEIRLLLIDTNPIDDNINKYLLENDRLQAPKTAKIIYEYVKSVKQLPRNKGYTNIGAVLEYAKNLSRFQKGQTIVVVCLTDGKPTGKQNTTIGSTEGIKVWFVGVEKDMYVNDLSRLTGKMGFKEDQVTIVTYPYWEDELDHFESGIGRAKNLEIINYLEGKGVLF